MEYWYFRFEKHFFDKQEVIFMEHEPAGDEYLIILLKMYCLAVDNGGTYTLPAQNFDDIFVLADILRRNPQTVRRALNYFIEHGFMTVSGEDNPNGFIEMNFPYIKNMTGRSTTSADRKRQIRHEQREDRKELPQPQEKDRGTLEAFGIFDNVLLSTAEQSKFCRDYENGKDIINRLSMYKRQHNVEYADDYAALLRWAEKDGVKASKDKHTTAYYKHLHQKAKAEAAERKRIIAEAVPELPQIEAELQKLYPAYASSFKNPEERKDISAQIERLTGKKEAGLKKAGYSLSDLSPKYLCPICEDTGRRSDGQRCECWPQRAREAQDWNANNGEV